MGEPAGRGDVLRARWKVEKKEGREVKRERRDFICLTAASAAR